MRRLMCGGLSLEKEMELVEMELVEMETQMEVENELERSDSNGADSPSPNGLSGGKSPSTNGSKR